MIPGVDLRFHHIGVACRALHIERRGWESLGYVQEGDTFADPVQGVSGLFMTGPGPRVELLAPLDGSETLAPFLAAGTKMYHQAYETPDLAVASDALKAQRAKVICPPVPSVAFGGRHIMFLILPTTLIVELIATG